MLALLMRNFFINSGILMPFSSIANRTLRPRFILRSISCFFTSLGYIDCDKY